MNPQMIKHGYKLILISLIPFVLAFVYSDSFVTWMIFAFLLFFGGLFNVIKGKLETNKPKYLRNPYGLPNSLLITCLVLLALIVGSIIDVRREVGYSGSEGELGAVFYVLILVVLIPITLIAYIITYIVNKSR